MPGDINNTDILNSNNQLIKAVNDLELAIQDLVLTSTCSPTINTSCPAPNVYVTCQCDSGTQPPMDPGTEGETAPDGYEDPPTPGYDRKCRVANLFYDEVYYIIDQFEIYGVETIISVFVGTAAALIGNILLATVLVGYSVFSLVGGIPGIIIALMTSVDLTSLKTILSNNKEDLICALYNSTDAVSAIADFKHVLQDNGANSAQMVLIDSIVTVMAANVLYFKLTGSQGNSVEAALDGYTGTVDCAVCGTTWGAFTLNNGTLVSGSLAAGTTGFTLESVFIDGSECDRHQVYFRGPIDTCVSITVSETGLVDKVCSGDGYCWYYMDCDGGDNYSTTFTPGTYCLYPNGQFVVRSQVANQFNLIVVVNGVCE